MSDLDILYQLFIGFIWFMIVFIPCYLAGRFYEHIFGEMSESAKQYNQIINEFLL